MLAAKTQTVEGLRASTCFSADATKSAKPRPCLRKKAIGACGSTALAAMGGPRKRRREGRAIMVADEPLRCACAETNYSTALQQEGKEW